ncbi:mucin-2-like [Acipenser ruthenus]|uniref:mucin-2-like n=1 Tax=Acipenser ruthenus TaxID=7906 RepID=UPI0027421C87|nr:mucin-2-like [Acipenser ruthenus]
MVFGLVAAYLLAERQRMMIDYESSEYSSEEDDYCEEEPSASSKAVQPNAPGPAPPCKPLSEVSQKSRKRKQEDKLKVAQVNQPPEKKPIPSTRGAIQPTSKAIPSQNSVVQLPSTSGAVQPVPSKVVPCKTVPSQKGVIQPQYTRGAVQPVPSKITTSKTVLSQISVLKPPSIRGAVQPVPSKATASQNVIIQPATTTGIVQLVSYKTVPSSIGQPVSYKTVPSSIGQPVSYKTVPSSIGQPVSYKTVPSSIGQPVSYKTVPSSIGQPVSYKTVPSKTAPFQTSIVQPSTTSGTAQPVPYKTTPSQTGVQQPQFGVIAGTRGNSPGDQFTTSIYQHSLFDSMMVDVQNQGFAQVCSKLHSINVYLQDNNSILQKQTCILKQVASGIQQPAQKSPVFTSSSTQTRESSFICSTGSQTEPWEVPVCQPFLPNPPITVPPKQEYTRKLRSHSKGHPQNF